MNARYERGRPGRHLMVHAVNSSPPVAMARPPLTPDQQKALDERTAELCEELGLHESKAREQAAIELGLIPYTDPDTGIVMEP
jgi:hypothetical protein